MQSFSILISYLHEALRTEALHNDFTYDDSAYNGSAYDGSTTEALYKSFVQIFVWSFVRSLHTQSFVQSFV